MTGRLVWFGWLADGGYRWRSFELADAEVYVQMDPFTATAQLVDERYPGQNWSVSAAHVEIGEQDAGELIDSRLLDRARLTARDEALLSLGGSW